MDVDGREVRVSRPDKVYFPAIDATKSDLVSYYLGSASTSSTPPAAVPPCCSGSRTAPPASRSSRSGSRPAPRTGCSRRSSRPPTGRRPTRWWWRTSPTSCGPSTSAASDSICGRIGRRPRARRRAAHRPRPHQGIGFDEVRAAALNQGAARRVGPGQLPQDDGQPGIHVYLRLEPRWDSIAVRAAAVALARELERRHPDEITAKWWKEERGTPVFVDFNQNAPHKTVFGAWFARPRVGGQVSTPLVVGRGRDGRARRAHDPIRCPSWWQARRPVGRHRRRAAVDRTAARAWPSGTRRPGSRTRRGPRSTPRCPTSPHGWRRAGRRRETA